MKQPMYAFVAGAAICCAMVFLGMLVWVGQGLPVDYKFGLAFGTICIGICYLFFMLAKLSEMNLRAVQVAGENSAGEKGVWNFVGFEHPSEFMLKFKDI